MLVLQRRHADEHGGDVRTGRQVLIWTQDEPGGAWNETLANDFGAPVWAVVERHERLGSLGRKQPRDGVEGERRRKWDQIAAADQ